VVAFFLDQNLVVVAFFLDLDLAFLGLACLEVDLVLDHNLVVAFFLDLDLAFLDLAFGIQVVVHLVDSDLVVEVLDWVDLG